MKPGTAGANAVDLLHEAAAGQGDRPAVVAADGKVLWTFAALAAAAARLAAGLTAAGLRPGDRVVAVVSDARWFVLVTAATLWAGGALVVPARGMGLRRALRAVAESNPAVVIGAPAALLASRLLGRARPLPLFLSTGGGGWPARGRLIDLAKAPPMAAVPRAASDVALISHTSGTTGVPKCVVRSHGVLLAQHEALRSVRRLTSDDTCLVGVPLILLQNLVMGVTSVLPPIGEMTRERTRAALRETVRRARPTTMVGFPALFEALVGGGSMLDLSFVRAMEVGGAPVTPTLLQALRTSAPRAAITVVYGCTEAEPIAAIPAEDYLAALATARPGAGLCVGQSVPMVRVRLAPLAGGSGAGTGRVQVAGPNVATPVEGDGWHDTGDLGRFDGVGRLWLLGRAAHAGPDGLTPAAVEEAASALPWVAAAVLVNVGSDAAPASVLAVVPRTGDWSAQADELARLVCARGWALAGVAGVPRLPMDRRTGSKIDYRALTNLIVRGRQTVWLTPRR